MAEQPSPPPEEESEQDAVMPFYDSSATGGSAVRVRAGWATEDEVVDLVLDYAGPVETASQVLQAAFSWYVTQLQDIAERSGDE